MKFVTLVPISILLFILFPKGTLGHEGEEHKKEKYNDNSSSTIHSKDLLLKIDKEYFLEIRPIFQKKCLDCHGTSNPLPWYYSIPGVKQLMDNDIAEAKKHMDMTNGFPFEGHGTPEEDLKALKETINKDSMPPLRYKVINWNSKLTVKEKNTIKNWIKRSLNHLTKGEEK